MVPSLITGDPEREPNFILHWLNNKEMHFTMQAENILHELTRKGMEKEEGADSNRDSSEQHDSEHDEKGGSKLLIPITSPCQSCCMYVLLFHLFTLLPIRAENWSCWEGIVSG